MSRLISTCAVVATALESADHTTFNEWKVTVGRSYSSKEEESYRFGVFQSKLRYYEQRNAEDTATYGPDDMADQTHEEFAAKYSAPQEAEWKDGYPPEYCTDPAPMDTAAVLKELGDSVDWRTKGAVQAVKDQGQCGSCWAFSTTASLESANAVFGSGLANISEQQLVDCSGSYGNMGCNGGLMDQAFQYIIDKGIQNEDAYPYTARDGSCKHDDGDNHMTSYTDVKSGSTDDLQNSNTKQPVSIAVDAMTWQFYSGGVFSNCGTSLDHGVLLAGYTADYWIVKNSWGASWGEQGYIRLKSGNTCGLSNMASYPTL